MTRTATATPRLVLIAQTLLWLTFALSLATVVVSFAGAVHESVTLIDFFAAVAPSIAIFAIHAAALIALGRGHGWIRWWMAGAMLLLVAVFVSVELDAFLRGDYEAPNPRILVIVVPTVLRVVALTLLFSPRSNEWFAQMRDRRRSERASGRTVSE